MLRGRIGTPEEVVIGADDEGCAFGCSSAAGVMSSDREVDLPLLVPFVPVDDARSIGGEAFSADTSGGVMVTDGAAIVVDDDDSGRVVVDDEAFRSPTGDLRSFVADFRASVERLRSSDGDADERLRSSAGDADDFRLLIRGELVEVLFSSPSISSFGTANVVRIRSEDRRCGVNGKSLSSESDSCIIGSSALST
jgi:hypothetical protein